MAHDCLEGSQAPFDAIAPCLVEGSVYFLVTVLSEVGLDYSLLFLVSEGLDWSSMEPGACSGLRWSELEVLVLSYNFHHIDEGALDQLEEGFVELECLIVPDIDGFLLVVPFDEGVVGIELADALLPEPLPDLHELFPERALLLGAEVLDLDVALVPQELLDVVDGLPVYFVEVGPVPLWGPSYIDLYMSGKKC